MSANPRNPRTTPNRRRFLAAAAATASAPLLAGRPLLPFAAAADDHPAPTAEPAPRKRIAIVATVWTYQSHAQHMGDRFLVGYPRDGRWHRPPIDVVSAYVDQKPDGDLAAARAEAHGFEIHPTIAEALRCGGDRLAVDGVVVIAEHGNYPRNDKGQILYPRREFFGQIAEVFERDGRSVPVFNDKHLSYSAEKAAEMVAEARRLKIPFLAGSSLPVTWRLPPVEIPLGAKVEEALMVGVGGSDAMDYHALEAMQCMVERRKGGETGVKSVQILDGDAVWRAGEDGLWSKRLLQAALSRTDTLRGDSDLDSRPQDVVENGALPSLAKSPAAYLIERRDGLRTTLLMLDGAVADYTFAARLEGGRILSTQFFLPPTPNVTYSARLVAAIEDLILTGVPPYPVERTWIASAILDRCLDSRARGNARLETPDLDIAYQPPARSRFGG